MPLDPSAVGPRHARFGCRVSEVTAEMVVLSAFGELDLATRDALNAALSGLAADPRR